MDRWPHQTMAEQDVLVALDRGERRVCVTSPTGGGKTAMMFDLARYAVEAGEKVVLYTNRLMLLRQTSEKMLAMGLAHGVRAAGHADERWEPFQIASIQTEHARVSAGGDWHLHEADLVLVDEAHAQTGPKVSKILAAHVEQGASYVGFTATPVGLAGLYDCLVVAGTPSELRLCGALVPCLHYGPDEPDLRRIGRFALGEDLTEKQQRKAMVVPGIYGRVVDWYRRLNPDNRPTILFAPGVGESVMFAEEFVKAGISAAHIDGQDTWLDGRWRRTDDSARREILDGSRSGRISVLCNRFVLREGIDAPWLEHGILATVFGSLQSYLQAGGRLLRVHPGLGRVTVQDHGGNWWRHGSLNADRQWRLDRTGGQIAALREERFRAKAEREPARCPRCALILVGPRCPCGFEMASRPKSRPVLQADGSEKFLEGDIYRPRSVISGPGPEARWRSMYYRACNDGTMTFRQAEALFAQENGGYPDRSMPLMPTSPDQWIRRVVDVAKEELT